MPEIGGTSDTTSVPPQYCKYQVTQENFAKSVRENKMFEKELNAWAKEFKSFLDHIFAEALGLIRIFRLEWTIWRSR